MNNVPSAALAAALLLFLAVPGVRTPAQAAGQPGTEPSGPEGSGAALEIPEDLRPVADNRPLIPEVPPDGVRYDDNGFPEDPRGLLAVSPDGDAFSVGMRGEGFPFLLYAQFVNRQRDAVFLAREGL